MPGFAWVSLANECAENCQQPDTAAPWLSTKISRGCSRLVANGLTPRDVASALRLDLGEVLTWLQMQEGQR
jgi:hypothetical protein